MLTTTRVVQVVHLGGSSEPPGWADERLPPNVGKVLVKKGLPLHALL